MPEPSAGSGAARERLWLHALNTDECPGIVTRDGIEEPCEKPTTCIIDDPEGGPWAACTWHAHRYGTGHMVTLATIRAALRAVLGADEDDVFGDLAVAIARAVEGQVASAVNGFGTDLVRVERCYSHRIARAALTALRARVIPSSEETCPGCTEHHLADQHAPGDPVPMTDGSAHVIPSEGTARRAVRGHRGHAESWNDAGDRSADEVLAYLRSAEVTDTDLAETFGPQWEQIVALVRRCAALTPDETERLAAARPARGAARPARVAARAAALGAALGAAWAAAGAAAGAAARAAAQDAAWAAAWAAAWGAALDAARDAAQALATRDLVGTDDYTQDHYDTLTRPWRTVIGPLHPDDAPMEPR